MRLGAARSVVEVGQYQHDSETILKKLDAIEARQPRSVVPMRSLGTIRTRVERLASVCLAAPEPVIIHWELWEEPCPSCGADLDDLAGAQALAEVSADRARGANRMFYWTADLTTCPRCHARLP